MLSIYRRLGEFKVELDAKIKAWEEKQKLIKLTMEAEENLQKSLKHRARVDENKDMG